MQYHGCRSHLKDRSKVTALEDKFDLLVDANDAVLERVVSAAVRGLFGDLRRSNAAAAVRLPVIKGIFHFRVFYLTRPLASTGISSRSSPPDCKPQRP